MSNEEDQNQGPRIRRARVDSLDLYEITEDELTTLEHGSSESLFLVFSTFLISVASSFLITILTTKIESNRLFETFVIVTLIGYIIGFILLILWIKARRSSSSVGKKIRDRMKEEEKLSEDIEANKSDDTSTIGNVSS